MADKFLNTGQGAVNLSNGTVNIIAAELGAVNLVPSKPIKTNATKQLVSENLDIADITNLQSELSTKLSTTGGTVTGDLQIDGGSLLLENYTDTLRFRNNNADIAEIGVGVVQPSQALDIVGSSIAGTNTVKIWNNLNVAGNVEFNGSINGISDTTLQYTSGLTSDVQTQISTIVTDISGRLSLSGADTMAGDLQLGGNGITGIDAISSQHPYSIETKAVEFKIDSEDYGSCVLRMSADKSNLVETYTPKIIFEMDGYQEQGAVFMGNNDLNLASSTTSNGGINLRTINTMGDWDTAPVRLKVTTAGGTIVQGSDGAMTDYALRQFYIKHPDCTGTLEKGWVFGCQTDLKPTSNDMDMYLECRRGIDNRIAGAFWDQNGSGTTAINFTGQHRCTGLDMKSLESNIGKVVIATGMYRNFVEPGQCIGQNANITITDAIPIIELCDSPSDKRVLGVLAKKEESNRSYDVGMFGTFYDKIDGDDRAYINSLGEGAIWISDANGPLENGDLLTSWYGGYAVKQDDDIVRSTTIGKITMDCNFAPETEPMQCYDHTDDNGEMVFRPMLNDAGEPMYEPAYQTGTYTGGSIIYKTAFVGCIYMCG
jgi:hypothetical protein